MSQSDPTVLYETRGPVALITLNRPEKLNAIDARMVGELGETLDRAEADDAVRAVVLRGAGRAFSAGFDLDMGDPGDADRTEFLRRELERDLAVILRFWDCPKPTIAAVHTWCLGSGMELAVACDVTIAAEGCRFGAPEVKFGSGIVALILPWLIGFKQAKELLLTGDDRIPAERALAMGLVNRVVPAEELESQALAVAHGIALNDRVAVTLTKQALNRSADIMGLRQSLQQGLELDVLIEAMETPESREFNQILETRGAKAAIRWREERLSGLSK
jgi:enoyl-CoA hydratase